MIKMFISKKGHVVYEDKEYPLPIGSKLYNRSKNLCEYPVDSVYVQKLFKDILEQIIGVNNE